MNIWVRYSALLVYRKRDTLMLRRALPLLLLLLSGLVFASPFDGVWGYRWRSCGGAEWCHASETPTGGARWSFEAIRIVSYGKRICAVWYSNTWSKYYRGFAVGTIEGDLLVYSRGQEMDHDPAFYEVKSFAEVPSFTREHHLQNMARIKAGRLKIHEFNSPSEQYDRSYTRLSPSQIRQYGLDAPQPWEPEFFDSCRLGSSPSLHPTRRSAHRQLPQAGELKR